MGADREQPARASPQLCLLEASVAQKLGKHQGELFLLDNQRPFGYFPTVN
jgi:hypothetical protein